MNKKEIAEIKRRYTPDKHGITTVRGCYVNEHNDIISTFRNSVLMMLEEESEKYFEIFKRTISGTLGKNLIDVDFSAGQVSFDEEHKLLMKLNETALNDDETVNIFFSKIIEAVNIDGNYLILLMHDVYDVPKFSKSGEKDVENSNEVFSYFMCSVCPVKMTKTSLHYDSDENNFHNSKLDWVVTPPEFGFMFPTFDSRKTNIYHSMFYTRNASNDNSMLFRSLFNSEAPMPAGTQKETFRSILSDTLEDECSYEVVQSVHEQLIGIAQEHKEAKLPDIPSVTKNGVKNLLEVCGVTEEKLQAFDEKYDESFGAHTSLSITNVIDEKQFEIKTPDVSIKVAPGCSDLVEIKTIDGAKYIMIRAGEDVEVNGVRVAGMIDDIRKESDVESAE